MSQSGGQWAEKTFSWHHKDMDHFAYEKAVHETKNWIEFAG